MKRTKLRKKSKSEIPKLKRKLWELCKEYIRKRDGNQCMSCGKTGLSGSGWHTGHLIPDAACGAYLRFDPRNLYSQCYYCNINLGGNGAALLRYVEQKHGKDFVDKLFADKQNIVKADKHFYEQKIQEYKQLLQHDD